MDKVLFVHNVKELCAIKGVPPTVACRESGVGASFINNIESKGQTPSVSKVQQLAQYLGCTTSELLGEGSVVRVTGTVLPPKEITQPIATVSDHWGYDELFPNHPKYLAVAQNLVVYGYGLRKAENNDEARIFDFRLRKELPIRLVLAAFNPGDTDPVDFAEDLAGKIYRQSCDLEEKNNQTAAPKGNGLVVEFAKLFAHLTPEKQNEVIAEMLRRQPDK